MVDHAQGYPTLRNPEQRKANMVNTIKQDGFLRLKQIIGNPKANPPIQPIIPICASSWWAGVASGRFPKPIKLGPRTTAWRASEVLALVNGGK